MALTDPEITVIARELAERIFVQSAVTAHSDKATLKSVISALDTALGATTTQVENAYSGVVLKIALRNYAQINAPNLTNQEAGVALALWALHEVGLL